MPDNDPASKPSDRMTNSGEPQSAPPSYGDSEGQRVRSPLNGRTRQDQEEVLWPKKPNKPPVPIEKI
jgi:hypothetical protein